MATYHNTQLKEIDFAKWIAGCVDPIIKYVEPFIDDSSLSDEQKAIRAYWFAFAQNTINLSRAMSYQPHHFSQMMMAFRLLQETSADIFYLKNHKESVARLVQVEKEVESLKTKDNFTLRAMSQLISNTDIRDKPADITQTRIQDANSYLEEKLGVGLTKDLDDIYNFLNGYTHFNPAGIYLQRNLTDHGYVETYLKILTYYPAWLYLVLISLSDLLCIQELDEDKVKEVIGTLETKIEESHQFEIGGFTSH